MTSDEDARRRARAMWKYVGDQRPPFAQEPGPGQESVWDYPRPPRIEPERREVVVFAGEVEIARSRQALRVLETASPPAIYLPLAALRPGCLSEAPGHSHCEWKGRARYWTVLAGGERLEAAAWSYPNPSAGAEWLRDHVSFYPARLRCLVGGAVVRPQPGGFYGGWITPELVGPFKGEPGSGHW